MYLKQDKRYSILKIKESSWCRVLCEGISIAMVMNEDTARQVIYKDILANGGTCEYLCENDFTKEK